MSNYLKNIRTAPLKAIAARVFEFLPKDSISIDKLEEWAYQAYESIAPREIYEVRIESAIVDNHRASLPIGMYHLEMILYRKYSGQIEPLTTYPIKNSYTVTSTTTNISTGVTTNNTVKSTVTTEKQSTVAKLNTDADNGTYSYDTVNSDDIVKTQLKYQQSGGGGWKPLRLATNVFHNGIVLNAPKDVTSNCSEAFSVQGDCIITTFSDGELMIAYTGIPMNDEGDYMYADYEYVSAALESALLKNYWKWKYNTGNTSGAGERYRMYSSELELLAPKASAALMMPSLIQYQNIRNMNKFINQDSPFSTVLGALNNTEIMNFQNPAVGGSGGYGKYAYSFNRM